MMKRRTFLQWLGGSQLGLTLAALGVTDAMLWRWSDRYYSALANPTPRKLALLVGINQYLRPALAGNTGAASAETLQGCVTDVALQRELLIHRFGFLPEDILTLTDLQATRQAIVDAFIDHLIQQAKPGDVVVFHFSGYGRQVNASSDLSNVSQIQNSLIPVDGLVPSPAGIKDVLEETLLLLLRSLSTAQVTTILDTSYGFRRPTIGNAGLESYLSPALAIDNKAAFLRLRNRVDLLTGSPIQAELDLQDNLLQQLRISRSQLSAARLAGQLPGVVLVATGDHLAQPANFSGTVLAPSNEVFEAKWTGFSAGLFTYALTQYFWWAMPATSLQVSINQATSTVEQLVGQAQQPILMGQKSQKPLPLASHLPPEPNLGADGVVIAVEADGKSIRLWLAGLPAIVLEYYGAGAVFQLKPLPVPMPIVPPTPATNVSPNHPEEMNRPWLLAPQVQLYGREGLIAKARLLESPDSTANLKMLLKPGQQIYEVIRVLSKDINLTVALDPDLERIERVDAISTLAAVPYVRPVIGDQPVDCLFGRLQVVAALSPDSIILSEDIGGAVIPITALTPDLTGNAASNANSNATDAAALKASLSDSGRIPPHSRYGLFSLGRELLPSTVGQKDEAIKVAIHRIVPHLHTLLAAKLLRLTANEGSSNLPVRATLEMIAPDNSVLALKETVRTVNNQAVVSSLSSGVDSIGVPKVPVGSRIRYQVQNLGDRPFYVMLLGVDSNGSFLTLYSGQQSLAGATTNKVVLQQIDVPAGETIALPANQNAVEWMVREPRGMAEVYLIACSQPFERTVAALESTLPAISNSQRLGSPTNPVEVARALLQDLHQASVASNADVSLPADGFSLNVSVWATLSFLYQVIG